MLSVYPGERRIEAGVGQPCMASAAALLDILISALRSRYRVSKGFQIHRGYLSNTAFFQHKAGAQFRGSGKLLPTHRTGFT